MKTEQQKVVFRVFKDGNIIALFPDDSYKYGSMYYTVCYQHSGQHASCDYKAVISITRPATEEQYRNLAKELTGMEYNLKVQQRANIRYKVI